MKAIVLKDFDTYKTGEILEMVYPIENPTIFGRIGESSIDESCFKYGYIALLNK